MPSLSPLSSLGLIDELSCPQIWNIEQEKDREKENVGGKPAKLNEKKKQRRHFFFVGRKLCSGGDKMRNASGHQCKVKMSSSEKK